MGTGDSVSAIVTRDRRSTVLLVGLALGLGFVLLVIVPVTAAIFLALAGGSGGTALGLLAVSLLGFLLVLAALPLAAIVFAWALLGATTAALESYVAEQRLRIVDWAATTEVSRWWGPIVKPAARLSFVNPLTGEERFEAALDRAKSDYASGALSEAGFERRLDEIFGLEPGDFTNVEPAARHQMTAQGGRIGRGEKATTERSPR